MNNILKIIILVITIFVLNGCLNFSTHSLSILENEVDERFEGQYEGSITITDGYNITNQGFVSITVSSGGVITINISGGYISLLSNIYKENTIKLSDNSYSASITSSGYKYDFIFSFSDYALNISFNRSDNTRGSGNLQKVR